ncbi:MAG TPA: hypothetical protein VGO75_15820 [Gemmatimonadaceae bacterium]|jgi:hypothetical protein|nr:hypothetical protein [Gemmatimonadaceae bacterium]
MNLIRRLAGIGALLLFPALRVHAQVIERPVPFDSGGLVMVMTPFLADRAALRPPWWPVSGEFTEARLFTVNDSSYVLAVGRKSGVVERYSLAAADRDAIRAVVSRLPRETLEVRNDARNAFIRSQTLLGLLVYAPTFAGAVGSNGVSATAAYLVVAGGTFFAASEISRRTLISRAQNDLSSNAGLNGALAGWASTYLVRSTNRAQAAGAFIGGITGTAIGLRAARNMTEADAVGAGFGADFGALMAFGVIEAIRGKESCQFDPNTGYTCTRSFSDRAEVATILASGLIGYPLGVLYPRNANYHVTPGDIQTLWTTAGLGAVTAAAFLNDHSSGRAVATSLTAGGLLGVIMGDRLLVRRYDHSRTEAGRLSLGWMAGSLMGAGIASLTDTNNPDTHLVFSAAAVGGLLGIIATERYLDPGSDSGRKWGRVTVNPASIFLMAARTPGNHSLINVRF